MDNLFFFPKWLLKSNYAVSHLPSEWGIISSLKAGIRSPQSVLWVFEQMPLININRCIITNYTAEMKERTWIFSDCIHNMLHHLLFFSFQILWTYLLITKGNISKFGNTAETVSFRIFYSVVLVNSDMFSLKIFFFNNDLNDTIVLKLCFLLHTQVEKKLTTVKPKIQQG